MSNDNVQEMYVVKRNGEHQEVSFDKILNRVKNLGNNMKPVLAINYSELVMKVIDQLHTNISTAVIDELTAEQCASLTTKHPDYGILASRIIISNNHKNTSPTFYEAMTKLHNFIDNHNNSVPLIHNTFWEKVEMYKEELNDMIDYNRDFEIDYFGYKTLERAYLMKIDKVTIERPQHMWLRVALGIHGMSNTLDIGEVKKTYDLMSEKYFTHATPTLFNAGTPRPQLSSCYLISMENDSIEGIYNTLQECAKISKWAGGIGLHIHNVRATGSHIRGTNGTSNGITPMLRVFNETARYVDQGGGKRNGSFAIYLEPWHGDILDFLELKKNHGDENNRARDLFYALWIPSLFMEMVKCNGDWSLFCPDNCPGLADCYGTEFNELYNKYANEGKAIKTVKAREIWYKILDSQMETGTPYLLYKDAANEKSNQKNIGVIKSSNLCTEIIEYSDKDETAVCNLASIALPRFVKETSPNFKDVTIYTKNECSWCVLMKLLLKNKNVKYKEVVLDNTQDFNAFKDKWQVSTVPQLVDTDTLVGGYTAVSKLLQNTFDYDKLHEVSKVITTNLNKIIDVNYYPTKKTERSNLLHRPIGIGVQGLADVFLLLNIPYHSEEAKIVNKNIFETIYHGALEKSYELSKERLADMNIVHNYINFDVNIFHNNYDDICRKYINISEKDLSAFDRVKPIKKELNISNKLLRGAYSTFEGSPASKGILQFDMWGVTPSSRYDWNLLKDNIKTYGLRNSLLVAPMPTASTAQILGNNECFEPFTSNIYSRRTNAGDFTMVNKHLLKDLINIGVWSENLKNNIILNKGSIQHLTNIPQALRDKYKIVWEIPMRHMIDMSADRGAYICQSQSLNLWLEDPNYKTLTSMHFYSWKLGLKTGIYYLRRKAKHQPQQFTIEPESNENTTPILDSEQDDVCEMCSA